MENLFKIQVKMVLSDEIMKSEVLQNVLDCNFEHRVGVFMWQAGGLFIFPLKRESWCLCITTLMRWDEGEPTLLPTQGIVKPPTQYRHSMRANNL